MEHCAACGSDRLRAFYELRGIPVQSCVLLESREEALAYPKGDLRLVLCEGCGFISNTLYSQDEQGALEEYESSQAHSQRFTDFLDAQCAELIDRHALAGKEVVEIGCGGGDFLKRLCELGACRGTGFDPTYPGPPGDAGDAVSFVRDLYGERYFDTPADLIACRHTLEHIARPLEFVEMVKRACERNEECAIFFEVPDTQRILDERAFWDIYYEHCSYFTGGSLARLMRRCGFEITSLELVFDGQYLVLSGRPGRADEPAPPATPEEDLARVIESADVFAKEVGEQLEGWRHALADWTQERANVVLWGAGSKAAGFLASLGEQPRIRSIVDINPRKQGRYQAGPGQQIIAPGDLRREPPDVVIVMNPIYREEIRRDLAELGLRPEIRAL